MNDSTPLTLAQAAQYFPQPQGRKVHVKTIKRRIVNGCRGVRLSGFKDGARWFTTLAAIRQFQDDCTRQALSAQHNPRTLRQQRREHQQAKQLLHERYGLHPHDDSSQTKTTSC